MLRHKEMYKSFFPLLLAIAAQQLLALSVNLVDNLMLGAYSETALSGAALVNQIQFILHQITCGIGAGAAVLGAQYWGKGEIAPIRSVIAIGLKISMAAGVLFTLAAALFPYGLLGLLCNDAETIEQGVRYLSLMRWTYLIFSASAALMYSLRAVQTAWIGTIMSVMTICINACLNYCFIYGRLGAPELGIYGAAVATLTSRCVELAVILVYVLCVDKKLKMRVRDFLRLDREYWRGYIIVAMPMMLSAALWGVAQAAQTAILGHIGQAAIAANSIASIIFQLFSVFGMACAQTASVVMGNTVGAGRLELVRPYSRAMQCIFLFMGLASSALILSFRGLIVGFYDISEETRRLTMDFLLVLSVTTVGSCYEYPVEAGIIAGGGDTKYTAIVDNAFMWLFTIPCAALSAFVLELSPVVTFCVLKADQVIKCLPNAIVCNRYRWVRDLTGYKK